METGMIKGMPLEWFAGLHILTADEVRHLPLNTAVMIISKDRYGIREWRCWSAKPTDEQRKAVKWDADP